MAGERRFTRAEAITVLCKARDDINAAIFALRIETMSALPWDVFCMWVSDTANTAEKLREQARGEHHNPSEPPYGGPPPLTQGRLSKRSY